MVGKSGVGDTPLSRRAPVTSPPSLFLPAFTLALLGLPNEH
jgi:hypothetical protein